MASVKMTKEFLTEALTNRTFDAEATELALRKSLDNSFSYLYRLQRNIVQYEEYHYTTRNIVEKPDYGDMFTDRYDRVCINFPVQLIRPHEKDAYRRSVYFHKEIPLESMLEEKELFTRIPVVLLDHQVLREFSVLVYEDSFTMIFPFEKNYLHGKPWDNEIINLNGTRGDNVYKEHTIDLQMIRNATVYDATMNTAMLKRNSYDKKSFNRVLRSYLEVMGGEKLSNETNGRYFAVLYTTKNKKLGSFLQEVELDEAGDFIIHWDETTLQTLETAGAITIRFIFYRYLHKYTCWREYGDIQVKKRPDGILSSEIALIYNNEKKRNYAMPVPTENLLVFHHNKEDNDVEWNHYDQRKVIIKYPNLYHIEEGVEEGETFHFYYFYHEGYDLHYNHMYWWFFGYLYYKFCVPDHMTIEELVNALYFDEIDLLTKFNFDINSDEFDESKLYEYWIHGMTLEDELIDNRWNPYVGEDAIITDPEDPILPWVKNVQWPNTTLNIMGYSEMAILRFRYIFNMLINIDAMDYRYDDIDYVRNYSNLTPLEYKITKLKSFIKDDMRCLHDYLLIENTTSIKHHFRVNAEKMRNRIRRYSEVHQMPLTEPMYLFTFEKLHPKDDITCRIFIDGFMYGEFVHETHGFTDFVYIPTRVIPDGVDVEFEIFPCLFEKTSLMFTEVEEVKEVTFSRERNIIPTLSDIILYNPEDIYDVYPHEWFTFTVVSDEYHYKESDSSILIFVMKKSYTFNESIWYDNYTNDVYRLYDNGKLEKFNSNGISEGFIPFEELPALTINISHSGMKIDRSKGYYNQVGEYFTSEGQPKPEKNISTFVLNELIVNGAAEGMMLLPTNNDCLVSPDENYIGYREVLAGSSILNPENRGVNNTKALKMLIALQNEELVGKEIAVRVEKDSGYIYRTFEQTDYPIVSLNLINPLIGNEFIRVFQNGRIVSKKRYAFITNFKNPRVQTLYKYTAGETIFLDATPYRNRLVYYKAELRKDWIVDLRGFIEKPFDIRYYDVYLNGRRLHERNIYPLTGWLLQLGGCHSLYNLEIYEKDRDWEYYACDWGDYYTVGDLIEESFMEPELKDQVIKMLYPDIPPNDNTEERQPWDSDVTLEQLYFDMFYYGRLLPLGLATGDRDQWENMDILKNYTVVHDTYYQMDNEGNNVLFLNPDLYYDQKESKGRKWRVYLLGERDVIDDISLRLTEDPDDDYGIYIKKLEKYQMELKGV